ncbi:MAG: universal stress protein [Dehalococcoidia bacterium]|nr:universal stress protein [Dehalococcoidia bacterium]
MADPKPILVPLDGSKVAEHALPAATWYLKLTGAPLKFVHVIDPRNQAGSAGEGSGVVPELRR